MPFSSPSSSSKIAKKSASVLRLLRNRHFGHHDHEILGQFSAGFLDQGGYENVECPQSAFFHLFGKRFDADAYER
jgi:hypothetical protein